MKAEKKLTKMTNKYFQQTLRKKSADIEKKGQKKK